MPQLPPFLKRGDKIAITCPAKKLPKDIEPAISVLESWGLEVVRGKTLSSSFNQFAGTDGERRDEMQKFLDDPEIKAIIAGRGGYGSIRIIDEIDFTGFAAHPKWLVGFSDITVFLSHIEAKYDVAGLHAQMPYTFEDSTPEALESLRKALFGDALQYSYSPERKGRSGNASGILIGGNLTLLVMMMGSESEMDFAGKILFIEDVGEREYSIDRMMRMLDRAGKLKKLAGLIVGTFNEIEPEAIPFGQDAETIIHDIVSKYAYPVCFQFPCGHIADNRALFTGKEVSLNVGENKITLTLI
ncbi:LD-carboxypeptidase [Pedobacter sp. SYP-B3415]|uniref:S66 peptidase family protein n=1 Tax=Pedobacter sp. SYP-B3415 TaxID=2496641 RepID=UPI00101CD6BD|nr:LD-carboxypeptidase [Pedobacter sp. SYP-B3415]